MTENEVNQKVKEWLTKQRYQYKGILSSGDVPVPDGNRRVLIDHQGFRKEDLDLIWVEAKGSGTNFSELLAGFAKLLYAVYHGGGRGYLAVPSEEYEIIMEQKDFFDSISKGRVSALKIE